MGDDPTELTVGINPDAASSGRPRSQVAPGVASCTSNNGYECVVYDPIASAHKYDGQRDAVDMTLQLKAPVDCSKKATIALYRVQGNGDLPVAELQMFVRNCKTLPPPAAEVRQRQGRRRRRHDRRHSPTASTDPDPGCTSTTDTTENSELRRAGQRARSGSACSTTTSATRA